jgi:TonB family protein
MFNNLVESDLHAKENARRSWFFLGTLVAYALSLMIAGVVSIYAYDARLEEQTNEYSVTFIPPVQPNEPQAPRRDVQTSAPDRNRAGSRDSIRTDFIARVSESVNAPVHPSAVPSTVPELPSTGNVRLGPINLDAGSPNGPTSGGRSGGLDSTNVPPVVVNVPGTPPPPRVVPSPQPKRTVSLGVLNGQAIDLPKPVYPQPAKIVKASGMVTVQVLIDETGKVVSAQAVSGHQLLRAPAVQAAYRARFTPTLLSNQPVKVSGVITYNFTL